MLLVGLEPRKKPVNPPGPSPASQTRQEGGQEAAKQRPSTAALTRGLGLGPCLHGAVLVVNGLAGQGEDPNLGHLDGGLLDAAAEAEHLAALGGVLHHLGAGLSSRGRRGAAQGPAMPPSGCAGTGARRAGGHWPRLGGQCRAQPLGTEGCQGGEGLSPVQRLWQEQTVCEAMALGHQARGSTSRDHGGPATSTGWGLVWHSQQPLGRPTGPVSPWSHSGGEKFQADQGQGHAPLCTPTCPGGRASVCQKLPLGSFDPNQMLGFHGPGYF